MFHNNSRPTSKAAKSDLKLNQNEKRKLAPAQAYCTYAWESGLRDIVLARWEERRSTSDEDDPTTSLIPIDFKLKIAKEVYESLDPEEKKAVDARRERDRKQLYMLVQDIQDVEERDKKLAMHQK